jgi:predicted transposase/invertase (TIGR01784 family)
MGKNIAKPKLDLVFKKIFGDENNTDLLIDFISSVLDVPVNSITNVEIVDNEVIPESIEKKFCRLDLLLKINDELINIEIQVNNYHDYKERTLFYWSKVYSNQLKKGEDYIELKNTITINIVDFKLFDCAESHSSFMVYETTRHEKLTDKLRIEFLELPKGSTYKSSDRLQEWFNFLNVTNEEGLDMLEKTTINPTIIGKAITVVRQMSADEKFLRDVQKREETLMNERSALKIAKKEGIQQGVLQRNAELIAKWKSKGLSDEQIQDLLN